jgi:hypothetical protein
VQSNDSESYASSSIAAGRVFRARQVKVDDPDKEKYPVTPG